MQRYKIELSYDGTEYAGWQVQPNGITVQEKLEWALREITGERPRVHGSGRTDQGVHARRQVAHFDLKPAKRPEALCTGLNAVLPSDIRVLTVKPADAGFHARKSAVSKEYRYFIWNGDVVPPFLVRYRTQVRKPLDAAAMARAAGFLEGKHDFAAFTANPNREVESTVRRLSELRVGAKGPEIVIKARADGFLYKMVRSLAGFLMRVGEGAVEPGRVKTVIASRRRTARVPTAPPQGLFLWNVKY